MRILLDENLSPSLVRRLVEKGIDAYHTRDRGLSGAEDHVVWRRAVDEGPVLTTIDARDFAKLASREALHGGLITLPSGFRPNEQWHLLEPAFDWVVTEEAAGRDLINRWVQIDTEGNRMVVQIGLLR